MKKSIFTCILLIGLQTSLYSAERKTSFIDSLAGEYSTQVNTCKLSSVEILGNARVETVESGAVIFLAVKIASLEQELSFSFTKGKGKISESRWEGDILPIYVTRILEWNTNEEQKKTMTKETERALLGSINNVVVSELAVIKNTKNLKITIDNEECILTKK